MEPDAGGLVLVGVIVPCAGRTGLPEVLVRVMLLELGPIPGIWKRTSCKQLDLLGRIGDLGRWNVVSISRNAWMIRCWGIEVMNR